MNDLSIAKFDPLKAEIISLVENIKTTVASASGAEGYELMKENKKVLQIRRTDLVKYLKSEREGFINGQKFVVKFEKECLELIADVEQPLDDKIKTIDDARKREERIAILPERKEKLASIEIEMTDDEILDMDDKQFAQYFVDRKIEYLQAKQDKIDAENKRIEDERLFKENEIKRQADLDKARKEGEKIAKQKAKEAEEKRIAKEKKDEEDRVAAEKAENERLEKMKKYQKFLADNGCSKETESEFYIKKDETKVVLYKKVGEFKI
jgi:phage-related minor tail protein